MQTFKPRWSRNTVRDAKGNNGIFGKNCHYGLVPKISGENTVQDANLAAEAIFGIFGTDPSPLSPTQWRVTPLESARALELWAADGCQQPNGAQLDAACLFVGLDSNYLPEVEHAEF